MKAAPHSPNISQLPPSQSRPQQPTVITLGNNRLRLLDTGNREFERGIRRDITHRQSKELKAVIQAVRNYQAQKTPSLPALAKIDNALQFWLKSGRNRSRQQDPVLQRLVNDIASRRQAFSQGGQAPSFQRAWVCNEQGRINQPIESNHHIRQWIGELTHLRQQGAHDLFKRELQSGLDLMFGVSETMTACRLERAPTQEEVAGSHEWKAFCGALRLQLPTLGALQPQATAEENGRDILIAHSHLLEMGHLKEVLALSLAQKVKQQGEIGLLRTELLTALVDGLDAPYQALAEEKKLLWQGESKQKMSYELGVRAELKRPLDVASHEIKPGQPVSQKEFIDIGLINASVLVEAFAKIEIGKWEARSQSPIGEFSTKATLVQENMAGAKAEAMIGKVEGSLAFNSAPRILNETEGERYKPGPHDVSLLRIGASAELVSKLGLSVEGSWTVGNLLNAKLEGAAEVGVNAKLGAEAALMMTPAGPMARVTANASAFAGLKAEGSAQLNLFKSQYANAYSLSAKVRAAANLGVGATAGATAAIGSAGVKLHTTLGVTLGVGTEVGWEGSVNAMATKAYALELAARAMSRFDQSKGQYLDNRAMAIGIESRLYELAQRMDSRIATLASELDELQLAVSDNRLRLQESPIDPHTTAGRSAMAQAIDDAFGQERVDENGLITFPERASERNDKLELTARLLQNHAIKV
ncbi:type III secretion system cytotoxic effector protein [Pseudomonas baetica]|uniref:Type III secretion system cytotoxic effector protein n=1 Tax=Pseudomonas baetica TaxID=674054 RepID=A0ABX4Q7L1_9PSED|nr:hypothetical protein [Pseudomonas baetica]PKA72782.1 type III secretion system cytotoxic effector protein [Pseudomonas baetica]